MHVHDEKQFLADLVSKVLDQVVKPSSVQPMHGGSISRSYTVTAAGKAYFVKLNNGEAALDMFKREEEGLLQLSQKSTFKIPSVIKVAQLESSSFIIMEYVKATGRAKNYWQQLGYQLAVLHRNSNDYFGWSANNYIGSLPQANPKTMGWPKFYAEYRLLPLLKLAQDNNFVNHEFVQHFEMIIPRITDLMPNEAPALVHGDLWSGNVITDENGNPCLIDPAIYYGHREMDIAFSKLFGGFADEFYEAYAEEFPLVPGFATRVDLYNLYPLLVHLNLFGQSYLGQIRQTIKRFT